MLICYNQQVTRPGLCEQQSFKTELPRWSKLFQCKLFCAFLWATACKVLVHWLFTDTREWQILLTYSYMTLLCHCTGETSAIQIKHKFIVATLHAFCRCVNIVIILAFAVNHHPKKNLPLLKFIVMITYLKKFILQYIPVTILHFFRVCWVPTKYCQCRLQILVSSKKIHAHMKGYCINGLKLL